MTKKLLDVSDKIDAATVSLYRIFNEVAGKMPWFVIGATARDLFLHYEYGLAVLRATRDVDFGVQLGSWAEFNDLRTRLLETGVFTPGDSEQRLYHSTRLPLDLIPFGEIVPHGDVLKWPAPGSTEIDVTGYDDALRNAKWVRLATAPNLDVRVATPVGIAILKTLAWADNPLTRGKDAEDLAYLLLNYLDLGNWDRLEGPDSDLTEVEGFNTILAGARMLGRDIARCASPETATAVRRVLEREQREDSEALLAAEMFRTLKKQPVDPISIIRSMEQGLRE